jgi:hypothetical protein
VTWLLKAVIAEPEETAITRFCKHVFTSTRSHDNTITEELLEAVFSAGSVQKLYNKTLSLPESVWTRRSWLRCGRVASQWGLWGHWAMEAEDGVRSHWAMKAEDGVRSHWAMEAEDGVRNHYHSTTSEHTADREDLVRTVLNCSLCELATAL